jgi:GDPmannose 4,6-dehydratase
LKSALITGITGQDGSYLAEFLLEKGYEIHGIRRRGSTRNTERLNQFDDSDHDGTIRLHYGDLADGGNISRLIQDIKPDEVYNLAAQSDVGVSFLQPEYTGEVNGLGVVRLLDAIREVDLDTRIYQASTSELFGDVESQPQDESTPFHPRSPYGTAKLYAYWITQNYREAYDMFVSNGILFNHESPRRGENFVTRKITLGTAEIDQGRSTPIQLGNLDARRDWGFAPEYVRAMWSMLQEDAPDDYVVATGEAHTVREFVTKAFECVGRTVEWEGDGVDERGYDRDTGQELVTVESELFRPADVNALVGDASKIQRELGWQPDTTFSELVEIMVQSDLERVRQ